MEKRASSPVIQYVSRCSPMSVHRLFSMHSEYLGTWQPAGHMSSFATLPVTTSSSERSFSALKFIKNYLRSTVTDERLNELALLFVHPDITLDYDAVIDEFGKPNRWLQFLANRLYGWLYGMSMTSVVCNVPVLSQNASTYHHSVFTT